MSPSDHSYTGRVAVLYAYCRHIELGRARSAYVALRWARWL